MELNQVSPGIADTGTDIAVIGGGMSLMHAAEEAAKNGKYNVTAIIGNPFLEFPMAATITMVDPTKYKKWCCGNPATFQASKLPNLTYIYDAVEEVDPQTKTIKFACKNPSMNSVATLKYKSVIIATGGKLPLLMPTPGQTYAERLNQVQATSQAIAKAKTIVINGPGTVGLEVAGDIRAKYPILKGAASANNKKIILLTRSGTVLKTHPAKIQAKIMAMLKKREIELVKGSIPKSSTEFLEAQLSPVVVPLTDGSDEIKTRIKADIYIPAYGQGPNTDLLRQSGSSALNKRGQIEANECLQSTKFPEIFGVNTTSIPLVGHPVSSRVTAQAITCAKNAQLVCDGKPPVPHVDKESPPPSELPMNIKVGHGKNGYMLWELTGPASICCCQPCRGGFPFCPLPCCWCCSPGCAFCLGTCGGDAGGEGAAIFMNDFLLPKFTAPHLYRGIGDLPPADAPAATSMAR
jgi:NADH dehydrogenase FAD-containing subunit